MDALNTASALGQVIKHHAILAEAARALRLAADSITDATFHPEDDSPQDLAAEIKSGAGAAADELLPILGLLEGLSSLGSEPTEEIDLDDEALQDLKQAAAQMHKGR